MTKSCQAHQIRETQSVAMAFYHLAPADVSFDDVTDSSYWAHTWKIFENRPNSTIEIVADDNSWEAMFRILSARDGVMKFRLLRKMEDTTAKVAAPEGYRIEHMTGAGWRVVAPDGSIVTHGQALRSDAAGLAIEHADRVTNAKKSIKRAAA